MFSLYKMFVFRGLRINPALAVFACRGGVSWRANGSRKDVVLALFKRLAMHFFYALKDTLCRCVSRLQRLREKAREFVQVIMSADSRQSRGSKIPADEMGRAWFSQRKGTEETVTKIKRRDMRKKSDEESLWMEECELKSTCGSRAPHLASCDCWFS